MGVLGPHPQSVDFHAGEDTVHLGWDWIQIEGHWNTETSRMVFCLQFYPVTKYRHNANLKHHVACQIRHLSNISKFLLRTHPRKNENSLQNRKITNFGRRGRFGHQPYKFHRSGKNTEFSNRVRGFDPRDCVLFSAVLYFRKTVTAPYGREQEVSLIDSR